MHPANTGALDGQSGSLTTVAGMPLCLAGMAVALILFYSNALPLTIRLGCLCVFALLAVAQPLTGLLFVPLTATLYLIPATLIGLRAGETLVPLHEAALAATITAVAVRAWRGGSLRVSREFLRDWKPQALFLLAGLWGAAIALPTARDEALRELRWLIVEPLAFYAMLRWCAARWERTYQIATLALIVSGVAAASLGLLQFVGLDLVPLLGQKRSFSDNVIVIGMVRRVASVYGHPNNLGLFLGRVWPLSLALGVSAWRLRGIAPRWQAIGLVGAALIQLCGMAVSFSRGAWIGAVVAAGVLVLGLVGARMTQRRALALGALAALLVVAVGGAALALRAEGDSANVRMLLWREAIAYLNIHPLGIGLDQFLAYHNPASGLSRIDQSLVGTSEVYAAHPHNLLLDIWLRMGPLGVVAFGWLIVRQLRRAASSLREPLEQPLLLGALAAMAAALTHGLVDHFYFVPDLAIIFWLLVALMEQRPTTKSRWH
jgi:O-antigen ligase